MQKKRNRHSILFIILSLMIGLSACGDDISNGSNTINNQMFSKVGTIQGKVLDATTGNPIAGTDLEITLVQGTRHRTPNILITNETLPLAGEYAFSDVPVELDTGNITYKMVVRKPGYQRFEGNVTLADNSIAGGRLPNTTDTTYNRIANIYLFPEGATAPDVEVIVEFNQGPVIGAEVRLIQNATQNVATAELGNRLVPSPGLLPSPTTRTVLENGNAVARFPGSSLILGGAYSPVVLPVQHGAIQLTGPAEAVAQIIVGGASNIPVVVAMADLEAGGQADGLHVVFASNRDPGNITGLTNPGVLTLVFNRAVTVLDDVPGGTPFTASLPNAGGAILTGTGTDTSVTATLSPDGLTLTLTPVFTTTPDAGDREFDVVYAGGLLGIVGEEGAEGNEVFAEAPAAPAGLLFSIDGTVISDTVHVTGP